MLLLNNNYDNKRTTRTTFNKLNNTIIIKLF